MGPGSPAAAADDVSQSKPHPETYLTALRRLADAHPGLGAGECIVIEDTAGVGPFHVRRLLTAWKGGNKPLP